MDSITQALLGASVQGALLGRWQGRKALAYGAVLGTLPDLDVVIDYGDAVANMTYHRGFSHSLFVLSVVAVLLTWLVRRFRPDPRYSGTRLFATVWLVLVTHVLLDAFTSYGTQLFWPLTTPPIAWSSIFIIDPLYSVPLLLAVLAAGLFGLSGRIARWPAYALIISTGYLGFTLAGKQMAEHRVQSAVASQGIQAERMFSTPTPFNSLLWRVILVDGEHYYETLVSWWDDAPPTLVRLPRNVHLAKALSDSPQHERLQWFTGNVLRYDEDGNQLLVTDLRLGMTGFHPFRFPLAERTAKGWQLVPLPERLPANRGDMSRLASLWQRIWQQEPALPLAAWAAELNGSR
ncbi:metal-dependent hydrolase [Pseudomonas songnenensis]|jgi:inner membrane protein|uniref:Metal-dependent hydrolase n=1 Tax=Pseudomonas songnenensis TaxID=1176259 RepID=A0A482UEM7_9PSED|nr:metal-dependent hydrolase [Pseudomonas songnenensis]RYJ59539.1 metal-dependent hydrolase [Pseudomonas songnenensis]